MPHVQAGSHVRARGLGLAVIAAVALGGACAFDTETHQCEASGLRCGPGWVCAAAQDACIPAGGCGDRVIAAERGEACDDGNILGGDGCSADCSSEEVCGNAVVDRAAGEVCDDGNQTPGDGCSPDCILEESCGDGMASSGEVCDTAGDSSSCDADCTPRVCGDGYRNPAAGEACDTGGDTPSCDADCTSRVCGDGYRNPAAGEACDTGGDTSSCDADCTSRVCGDGYQNPVAEACDNGGANTSTCDSDCTLPVCGDGHVNPAAGEECESSVLCAPTKMCSNCRCL